MPALARHPRIHSPELDEHEENCAATICECELPGYADAVLGFDAHRQRRGPQLLRFLMALAMTGAVLAVAYLTGLGE